MAGVALTDTKISHTGKWDSDPHPRGWGCVKTLIISFYITHMLNPELGVALNLKWNFQLTEHCLDVYK